MADFPQRRPWVPPSDQDRERLTLTTARVLRALLTHDADAELTNTKRRDYLGLMDDALKPFGLAGSPLVDQEKRT